MVDMEENMMNVSKGVASVVTVALIVLGLSGCAHVHTWNAGEKIQLPGNWFATKKYTCSVCSATKFQDLTHSLSDSNGFVRVKGISLTGEEAWTPESEVLNREMVIPNLIVSDHEVTRGEFKEIMGVDPSKSPAYNKYGLQCREDCILNNPVSNVNWFHAIAYCNKKSLEEGLTPCYSVSVITDWEKLEYSAIPTENNYLEMEEWMQEWNEASCDFNANGYRLPTEAEWEWLARGGENFLYAGSNNRDNVAWYYRDDGTRDIKLKQENGYGLYDMSGNVAEWTWDLDKYSLLFRMVRGGSFMVDDCSITCRVGWMGPLQDVKTIGFRVVRTVSN